MSIRIRLVLITTAALCLARAAGAISSRDFVETRMIAPQIVAADGGFDYCLRDANGSVLRFSSSTGAYTVCGNDGTFEQGVGTISTQGSVVTLSHTFRSPALNGLESVHAIVNTATGQGQASIFGSKENAGKFTRFTINDPNVHDASDCSSCGAQSGLREGVINSALTPSHALSIANTVHDVTFLQQFSFNQDFAGQIIQFSAGLTRIGAGPLAFQLAVYSDKNGRPGDPIYLGPELNFATFPAAPGIGVVHLGVALDPGPTFWAGYHWNPSTDPLGVVFGTDDDAPLSKVYYCEPGQSCAPVTANSQFSTLRGLYLSADYRFPGLYSSGGLVRYGFPSTDIVSEKCDDTYRRIDLGSFGAVQLLAENESRFAPGNYSAAFARISPITNVAGTGLDGVASTRYLDMRYSAFSYVTPSALEFCTRPSDATDFVCHSVAGYSPGTCGYSRMVGVMGGYELSCANAPADWIDRWLLQYNGSAWSTQPLNPVKGSPSIGSPEFGFNWFAASGSKLGVAYEYKLTSGLIQAQLTKGNSIVGTYTIDTDDPPAGFNPSLASRTAADCTREGLCIFGRFDLRTKTNVADMVDFRETPPEIKSWSLGSSPSGLDFGRAVNLDRRDGTALYGSYTTSPIANQYRLQLDYIDLKLYKKFTLGFDYAAGAGNYPLSLSREGGDWGLGHSRGVDLFYSLTAGCDPARVGGHSDGGDSSASPPAFPCEDIPSVRRSF
jgi:hypothetical protein